MNHSTLRVIIALLAFVGILDSAYLTYNHFFNNSEVVCNVFAGCDQVLTSSFATIGPIPLALLGMVYYLVLFMLSLAAVNLPDAIWSKLLVLISGIGFLITIFLTYLQAFVIESWCQYCLISAITTTLIFVISLFQITKRPQLATEYESPGN